MRTWLSTLPSAYFVSSRVAASSTASLIAIPRLPGEFGSCWSFLLPACVSGLGVGLSCAPYVSISTTRYGLFLFDTLTRYTFHWRSEKLHSIARVEPLRLPTLS